MSIDCIIVLQNIIRLFLYFRHTLTLTKRTRMHVLCDEARMLGDDVFRVCSCCNLRRAQFGVSRSMHRLCHKILIQPALELCSIEHNNKITYTSSKDERLLKVYESRDSIKLPFKYLS